MPLIAEKLQKCGEKLSEWSLQSFGCIKKQIESKGKMLSKSEESVALGKADFEVVKILRAELNALLDKESLMWEQRARALFLKCGDRNTRYFHSKASHSDALVSVLIDDSKNCWIEEVVDNTFLPHEAAVIKAIPLSLDDVEDVRFWFVSADGIYTVKSGYKLIMENELRVLPSSSNLSLSKKVWKGIWSLRTPNRVKSLLWRAGLDALPSRVNLRKRKILTNDTCPQCNLAGETSLHALWSCPCLSPIWLAHFVTVSLIWARRNQLRVGEKVFPVSSVSSVAVDSLHEFQIASNTPKHASPIVCPPKWSPPPPGLLVARVSGYGFFNGFELSDDWCCWGGL
nr:putative ribonuclease h protein [Quercus suber]